MAEDRKDQEQEDHYRKLTMSIPLGGPPDYTVARLKDIECNWDAWVSPVFKDMSFEVVSAKYDALKETWKNTSAYEAFRTAIEETVFKQEKLSINACMCLGLGSFTGIYSTSWTRLRHYSLSQLVLFECWVEQLSTKFQHLATVMPALIILELKYNIEHVYFQEPSFNALDEEFLKSRGYEILHIPESDDRITEKTFLFTPLGTGYLVEASLRSAYPALYITQSLVRQMSSMYLPKLH